MRASMVASINSSAAEVTVCSRDGLKSSRIRRKKLAGSAWGEELSAISKDSIVHTDRGCVLAGYLLRHTVLLVDLPVFHHETNRFQGGHIGEWIAGDGNNVSQFAGFDG